MNSSTQNTKPAVSPKKPTAEFEEARNRGNHLAANQMAEEILEGFRKLAKDKAAQKAPDQAA